MFHKIKIFRSNLFIFLIIMVSCSSMDSTNKYYSSYLKILENKNLSQEYKNYPIFLYIDIESQLLFLIKKGKTSSIYKTSSSIYGVGSAEGSLKTPLGKHLISEKIGKDLPIGAILKGRVYTGSIANILTEPIDTDYDIVTSRILWLEGTEEDINKGLGVDSKSRFIYIHGTPEEGLIGKPASNGCIRMYNKDVIELFDIVDIKTPVWIY